jgi:Na+/H+ antiporter NhaD/arsenite permease-like protein
MTYINALEERNVFNFIRFKLVSRGYNFRQLFILTGVITFFLSPIADNLTTALVMCSVLLACGKGNVKFLSIGCINIVISANAGGAFSPFGDITTLMVWQAGIVDFITFFKLFIPSVVNYVIPATIMYFFIPNKKPDISSEVIVMKRGAKIIIFLGLFTIFSAVNFHNILHLPPMLGMMFGLGLLGIYSFYLKITYNEKYDDNKFDFLKKVSRAEWDTLLFFFGVILSVGGLGFIGYLSLISDYLYVGLGATYANIIVGILSAIVDNIPVMFAVISMNPTMSTEQWLLVTLTTGVGGSLLSIGSAAGVALMGQARGYYTFFGHMKWTPVIFLGYIASIYVHMFLSGLSL